MLLGSLIRNRRRELGLTLRAAAQQLGVDPAYLSRVESEKAPPSEHLLRGLAGLLEYNDDELLLLAGKLPPSLQALIEERPQAAAAIRSFADMMIREPGVEYGEPLLAERGQRAIEDGFPFEHISEIAELESWRKEIHRPIYHIHKWWARRLGSVFRAAILAAAAPRGSSIVDLFYEPVRLPGVVVFDPFMGSGTTIGEAQKLGCTVIGRDINPVAFRAVATALGPMDSREVEDLYNRLDRTVGPEIRDLYRSVDSDGAPCDVLYNFWVKTLPCPACGDTVDLFSRYVFAGHANPRQHPDVRVVCRDCGDIFGSTIDARTVNCGNCGSQFDPHSGPAKRTTAVCRSCTHEFPIAKTSRSAGKPPDHRMYAKLVLRADGVKEYLPPVRVDHEAFRKARRRLWEMDPPLPRVEIREGHNTRQILNYGYRYWHELFNDRQLLALSRLAKEIGDLPRGSARDALATLFSGALEFNNMFTSYKGEGTGAVRHMFAHHILKPARTPIEANLWGTAKSSGAFATLFRSRLIRALEYRHSPFEIAVTYKNSRKTGRKVIGISPPMGGEILDSFPPAGLPQGSTYLSCGDSAQTDIPDSSVHLVITDPPFFDNVHYSELADFFHVWQQLYFSEAIGDDEGTTRHRAEVQDTNPQAFSEKLEAVFKECYRVLRDDGLLVFSYHYPRDDGWSSVAQAILGAGFSAVQCQPVKSEMSVAAPKHQSKEPIDLDILVVCRKRMQDRRRRLERGEALRLATNGASQKTRRFNSVGRKLSRGDVHTLLLGQLLVELCAGRMSSDVSTDFNALLAEARRSIEDIHGDQIIQTPGDPVSFPAVPVQLDLL